MAYAGSTDRRVSAPVDGQRVPIPDQDDALSAPIWKAANEGRLVVQRCENCAVSYHPPIGVCPGCSSASELAFAPSAGTGRIYSWAIVRDQRLPEFEDEVPYVVASVQLDDAPGAFWQTTLPIDAVDTLEHDQPVRVWFDQIADGVFIPQFRPIDGAAS